MLSSFQSFPTNLLYYCNCTAIIYVHYSIREMISATSCVMTSAFALPISSTSSCETVAVSSCATGLPERCKSCYKFVHPVKRQKQRHTSAFTSSLMLRYVSFITTMFVTKLNTSTSKPSSLATTTSGIVLIPTTSAPDLRRKRPSAGVS